MGGGRKYATVTNRVEQGRRYRARQPYEQRQRIEIDGGGAVCEGVAQVDTHPGAGFELWIESEGRTVARWSAGSTARYVGTVCFQLELEKDGEAAPLGET